MDVNQYLDIFIEETKENLLNLNNCLLQMEKEPDDKSTLNEIFRVAHTLKGMSGTMGFTKMQGLTHDMENVLDALRNDEVSITPELTDTLFKCLDALENYLDEIMNTGSEGSEEFVEIIESLKKVLSGEVADNAQKEEINESNTPNTDNSAFTTANFELNAYEKNVIDKAVEMGMNVFKITIVLSKSCLLKAARSFIIFQTLEKDSDIIHAQPKIEDIEDEKFDFEFTVITVTSIEASVIQNELCSISEVESVVISPVENNDIESYAAITDDKDEKLSKVKNQGTKDNKQSDGAINKKIDRKPKAGKTVRVEIDRLDVLLNLVSELIIQKTRLEGIKGLEDNQEYNETLEYLKRITTNLHDAVMKVRMVPIETVFNRFPRMIRDISKELNKKIEFTMTGEETELDRTVIDEIGDPLIHLLRNSIDHGIESVDIRKEHGKDEVGKIFLRAYQDGNNVVIEVEDDGNGIDLDKVKNKAIQRELISEEVANSLSDKDIIDFLFKPSFSTADKVTDLSGRGVGLDVVKTKIENLGGHIEVITEKGKGSRFIIRLPLTLAIIQALLVYISNETYAIQLSSINQIINITTDEINMVNKQEVILLRDKVIPIIRLDEVLGVVREEEEEDTKKITVVIAKKGDKLCGFVVDGIIGQQEIVQKPLGKVLADIKIISSATILGDGNVALILDVNVLM